MTTWEELKTSLINRLQNAGVTRRGNERTELLEIIRVIAEWVNSGGRDAR